jgi:hypothetical protein
MSTKDRGFRIQLRRARILWGDLTMSSVRVLRTLIEVHGLSIDSGHIIFLSGTWYVTSAGLLNLSIRKNCIGIDVRPVLHLCDAKAQRWTFEARVYKSRCCRGFVGYGDADPSNVSPLVHGAEMRVAETRAVNRALRKAYGIGICSVEELGALTFEKQLPESVRKLPPQSVSNNGSNGTGPRVRDRLCQIIRRHELNAQLVKAYATDFCGTKTLREATREQVENFIVHLADWAEKDRSALLCQLNSYAKPQEGAA